MTDVARLASADPLPAAHKLALTREVLAVYAVARRSLHRADLPTLVRAARREWPGEATGLSEEQQLRAAARLGRVVTRTLRPLPTDTRCLITALVLSRLLARRGIASSLVLGVTPQEDFEAHAWVEHAGRAVLPPGGPRHARLVEV